MGNIKKKIDISKLKKGYNNICVDVDYDEDFECINKILNILFTDDEMLCIYGYREGVNFENDDELYSAKERINNYFEKNGVLKVVSMNNENDEIGTLMYIKKKYLDAILLDLMNRYLELTIFQLEESIEELEYRVIEKGKIIRVIYKELKKNLKYQVGTADGEKLIFEFDTGFIDKNIVFQVCQKLEELSQKA